MIDFISLLFLVVIYIFLVLLTSFSPQYIKLFTIGFSILYFSWGLWHHKREKSLHSKITLEYLLIALLGVWLIVSMF